MSTREYINLKISNSWMKYKLHDFEKSTTKWSTTKKYDTQVNGWRNRKLKTCETI